MRVGTMWSMCLLLMRISISPTGTTKVRPIEPAILSSPTRPSMTVVLRRNATWMVAGCLAQTKCRPSTTMSFQNCRSPLKRKSKPRSSQTLWPSSPLSMLPPATPSICGIATTNFLSGMVGGWEDLPRATMKCTCRVPDLCRTSVRTSGIMWRSPLPPMVAPTSGSMVKR